MDHIGEGDYQESIQDPPAPGTVGLNEHGHLIDIGTRAKWLRRQALFEATPDPKCAVCTERVETADDSVLFAPIGKPEVLVHHGPCFHQALMVSVTHYMDRGREMAVTS